METVALVLNVARDWAYPLSGFLFCLYPATILMWMVLEGRQAAPAVCKDLACEDAPSPKSFDESVDTDTKSHATGAFVEKRGRSRGASLPLFLAVAVVLVLLDAGLGFVACFGGVHASHGASHPDAASQAVVHPDRAGGATAGPATSAQGVHGGSAAVGTALVAGLAIAGLAASPRARGACRVAAARLAGIRGVPRYSPPPANGVSLWHDVDLHVKSWLDEDLGLYRYVNEMPLGCLQKFEVQPHLPENAVEEDPKGSKRLAAFGRPVPFNYGCFPQTFRDPNCVDELYGAPGDNDPLDVLDLATGAAGVGQVVRCRPLGAVCLIDEGEADWKILAVNVDAPEPIAKAQSIEEVHRIAPGRIAECLQWIDDFKKSSGKNEAKLDFQIHDLSTALRLIEQDHVCWQQLLQEAGPDGIARGQHWVRAPRRFVVTQRLPHLPVPLAKLGWPSSAGQPTRVPAPRPLAGVSLAMAAARGRIPSLRRQEPQPSSPSSSSP